MYIHIGLRNLKLARAMGKRTEFWCIFLCLVLGAISSGVIAEPVEDKEALLEFLDGILHSPSLNWSRASAVCRDWHGVYCNNNQSRVVALRLPGGGILGSIPPNTLSRLSALQILSMRRNRISGPFPSDFSRLESLTELYFQHNRFSGPLPKNFSLWKNLTIIDLSNNAFNGSIPLSISNLSRLSYLSLANNSFSGEIPDLNLPSLQQLNLANNNLSGSVPKSLQRFPSSVFSGNNISSVVVPPPAYPLQPPSSQPKEKIQRIGEPAILGIAIGGSVFAFMVVALFMILCFRKRREREGQIESQKKEDTSRKIVKKDISENLEKNKLFFFEGSNMAFDLEDLLRSSAEVLGKGTFGLTYKAALEDVQTIVVKRLKEVNATKREFEHQMQIFGNIKHDNVVPLRAYYYSKDEKLAVYDYCENGSLSATLHGNKGEGRAPLDWETRYKIAMGAARGIAHIHTQNGGKLIHGNIKASNVFLRSKGYGCVSDVGLITLMKPLPPQIYKVPGYRAPEVTDIRKVTQASDVYSYGVFILELLTGKSPIPTPGAENFVHLVRWVNATVREEWTAEVFDVQLLQYPDIEEELVEMLQLGLSCTSRMPEKRPNMLDVVVILEGIRREGTKNRLSPGSKSGTSTSTPTPRAAHRAFVSQTQVGSSSSFQK